jgi:hypothetical protein
VTAADAVRLVAALGAVEMALVRRDPVVGPLLAQAARAAADLPPGPLVAAAAAASRAVDLAGDSPAERAARKAVQALCRAAAQECQAAALAPFQVLGETQRPLP